MGAKERLEEELCEYLGAREFDPSDWPLENIADELYAAGYNDLEEISHDDLETYLKESNCTFDD